MRRDWDHRATKWVCHFWYACAFVLAFCGCMQDVNKHPKTRNG